MYLVAQCGFLFLFPGKLQISLFASLVLQPSAASTSMSEGFVQTHVS